MGIEETMRATLEEVRALRQEIHALASTRLDERVGKKQLITYEAAGAIADVKPATIGSWARRGVIRRHGTLKKPLVDEAELRAYLERERGPHRPTDPDESAAAMLARRKR
jgi:hypothetical protein